MTKMATLPRDLVEEILSRVPMTSLRRVRSTCKNWNNVSKDVMFLKKHLDVQAKVAATESRKKEFLVVMMMEYKVCLMNVNLHNNVESSYRINHQGRVISLDDSDQIDVLQIFHCDGLLLCIMKDKTRIMVWNPYTGQTRWNAPINKLRHQYKYALGYEKSSKSCLRSYKILRFIGIGCPTVAECQLYYPSSDSWRSLDVNSNEYIYTPSHYRGISLDGNTYWYATQSIPDIDRRFLLCFDFTKERFTPYLPLPFEFASGDSVTLSSVREEQLAVLLQRIGTLNMEIWVTNKIEPNMVSWSSKFFFALNMEPRSNVQLPSGDASFLIDEEKKVAVIFHQSMTSSPDYTCTLAYIVGVDGSMEIVHLGTSAYRYCYPLFCSYVPSLVQFN